MVGATALTCPMVLSHRLCSHAQHSLHRGLRSAWSRTPCTSKPFQHEESLYNGISQCPAHPGGSSCPPPPRKAFNPCTLLPSAFFFSFFFFLKHVLRLLLKHRNTEQLKTSTSFAFLSDLFTASSQNPLTQFGCLKGKKKKKGERRKRNRTTKQTNKQRTKQKQGKKNI